MPRRPNSLVLVLALGMGLIIFLLSLSTSKKRPAAMVLSAAKDIPIATAIRTDEVEYVAAPPNIPPKLLFSDAGQAVGKITRVDIVKGKVIQRSDLLQEGESSASLIPPGYRAMNIPATVPTGLANLLQVGNRVDVLLTFEKARGEVDTITLGKNVRIIGVSKPSEKNAAMGPTDNVFITLAVKPNGAETLAYAMKKGALTVTVYSASETGNQEEKFFDLNELFPTAAKDIPVSPGQPVLDEDAAIEIIRGVQMEKIRYQELGEQGTNHQKAAS